MDSHLIPCIGCGALVPNTDGPTHAYIGASPGCWAVFGEVQAREAGDSRYAEVRQCTVDTYAVQHPGKPERRSTQSVTVHLISLCTLVERGFESTAAIRAIRSALKFRDSFEWLTPPESLGDVTILYVRDATTPQTHTSRVREWASSVWRAWSPHHQVIHKWAAEAVRKV